jgi:hypothetical protein
MAYYLTPVLNNHIKPRPTSNQNQKPKQQPIGSQLLYSIMSTLKRMCHTFSCCAIVTNHVVKETGFDDRNGEQQQPTPPNASHNQGNQSKYENYQTLNSLWKPALGNKYLNMPQYRIILCGEDDDEGYRTVSLVSSVNNDVKKLRMNKRTFRIEESGISSPD